MPTFSEFKVSFRVAREEIWKKKSFLTQIFFLRGEKNA